MSARRSPWIVVALLVCAGPVGAAQVRTANFVVTAPDQRIAEQFGQMAEFYRKQKALEWIGQEMPTWPQPCPLYVKPTMSGAGGATKFDYRNGSYTVLSMEISGPLERMLNSVLPHEVTHTVFAHHYRFPVPRWADEGGAVLSEDDQERSRHDMMCRQFLNTPGGKFPLRRLFNVREYEDVNNVMIIYAEGFSVSNFLVGQADRATFLNFVSSGTRYGWDKAAQQYYGFQTVEQLEEGWLKSLRESKDVVRQPKANNGNTMLAAGPAPGATTGIATSREVVRLTAPPAQPQLDPAGPVFRGQASDEQRARPTTPPAGVIPIGPQQHQQSQSAPRTMPPPVSLGLPEYAPAAQPTPVRPNGPSPVGFQN